MIRRFSFGALCAFNLDPGGNGGGGAPANAGAGQGGGNGAGGKPGSLLAAAEIAAAAAGGAQGGNGQQGAGGQSAGQQGGGASPPGQQQAYFPEGLPDAFKGTSDKETIDKLAGEIAKLPKPPATPKDYTFNPGEDFIKKHGDLKDDPVMPLWREVAHEIGLDQKGFEAVVPKLYDKLEKAGLIDPPIDWAKESAQLEPASGDPKERSVKALQRVKNMEAQISALQTRGVINKEDAAILSTAYYDAAHVKAFEKVFALIPQQAGPQGGGVGGGAGSTKESVVRDMRDPRYDTMSPKYEPEFRQRVDAEHRRLHGG